MGEQYVQKSIRVTKKQAEYLYTKKNVSGHIRSLIDKDISGESEEEQRTSIREINYKTSIQMVLLTEIMQEIRGGTSLASDMDLSVESNLSDAFKFAISQYDFIMNGK